MPAGLVGGEQPLGDENGGRVGECGDRTLTTSPAVRGRSSVVPIRSVACRSQSEPMTKLACCAMTSTPEPGPASGSHRMATGPLPPANAMARVMFQTRPAAHLGQRLVGQFALARAGQQHVPQVPPDDRADRMPEQPLGGHRPGFHPPVWVQGERGQASQIRRTPSRQHWPAISGHPRLHRHLHQSCRPGRRLRAANFGNGHALFGPAVQPRAPIAQPCAIVQAEMYRTSRDKYGLSGTIMALEVRAGQHLTA